MSCPVFAAFALLLKLPLAAWVLRSLIRLRLLRLATAAAIVGAWCLVVAGLCALVFSLVPIQYVSVLNVTAGMALFVPFSRLALAPLALHWNRHR